MRIDGSHSVEPQGLPEHRTPPSAPPPARAPSQADDVPQLERAQDAYVAKALAAPDVRPEAVEAARKALQAGELDTPQAARRTAQAMLDQGV